MAGLATWHDGPAKRAIVDFVTRVVDDGGPDDLPPVERVAVFDNDGTLWPEKPMPIELGFILRRLAAMAADDPALRERQPWRAAYERDHAWLGQVVTEHYQGDDTNVRVLIGGILRAFAGTTVDVYAADAHAFLHEDGGTLAYQAEMEVFDDGPAKPVRIWSRIGRRPVLACEDSNGDVPMLAWAGGPSRPALRLLVNHDDGEREFAYTAGAEKALEAAAARRWTVVSVAGDSATVFGPPPP